MKNINPLQNPRFQDKTFKVFLKTKKKKNKKSSKIQFFFF